MALDDFTAKLTTGEDGCGRSKAIWNGCFRIRDETVADPTRKVPNETILADRHRILAPFSGPSRSRREDGPQFVSPYVSQRLGSLTECISHEHITHCI
jgi:hypothetical protein